MRQHLNFLEQKGVLRKGVKGRLTIYSLNLGNRNIIDYLVIAEKNRLLKRCGQEPLLKELVGFLRTLLNENNKALIFGSATESLKKANDVDVLITGKFDSQKLEKFAERFNIKTHAINVKALSNVSEALRLEITSKHLIISGSEEVIRWLLL
ncbi:hypothetical protein HYU20_00635 [Candidatus Woesearchaeota archaeon]|nr:hypothetical protein [Candidatus Woesearchaeota archaeon]